MTDLETELREAMATAVAGRRLPLNAMDLLRRAHHRHAVRAALAAAVAVAAIATAGGLAAAYAGGGSRLPGQPGASPAAAKPVPHASPRPGQPRLPPGWLRHGDGAGDFIDAPAGWHVGRLPALVSPAVLWVLGTGPVPDGGGCAPTAALRKLPADGFLLTVQEYAGVAGQQAVSEPYTFPPRAYRLGLGPLGGPFECWGMKTHLMVFEEGGRYFQVQTVFGARAQAPLRAEVRRAVNTLQIVPLPRSDQPAGRCQAGQWTYCQAASWVYRVLGAARVLQLGNRGSRALLASAGNRSFAIWTTGSRAGSLPGRCRPVSGVRVCREGSRLSWRAHGLLLWLEAASSPYATAPTRPGLPPDPALQRLVLASERVTRAAW